MKKTKKRNIKTEIRSALRRVWLYSELRSSALAKARVSRGVYQCQNPQCAELVGPKNIEIDHITKVTPKDGINTPEDWGVFIKNLLFCGPEGLVALCKNCHAVKTKAEKTKKKKAKRKKLKLSEVYNEDYAELKLLSREDQIKLFTRAIHELAQAYVLTPSQVRNLLKELPQLLADELDN